MEAKGICCPHNLTENRLTGSLWTKQTDSTWNLNKTHTKIKILHILNIPVNIKYL